MQKITIAGFGGQGVVLAGNLLAYAALAEGKHTTNMVSYGAEMRGGTANSTTIVSDEDIYSPFVEKPTVVIAMNQPSMDKFESKVADNGLMIINSSMIDKKVERKDINVIEVPLTDIATELGNVKVANIVAIGVLVKKTNVLRMEAVTKALQKVLSSKTELIDINKKAIQKGAEYVH